jgi:hypothetical protein
MQLLVILTTLDAKEVNAGIIWSMKLYILWIQSYLSRKSILGTDVTSIVKLHLSFDAIPDCVEKTNFFNILYPALLTRLVEEKFYSLLEKTLFTFFESLFGRHSGLQFI